MDITLNINGRSGNGGGGNTPPTPPNPPTPPTPPSPLPPTPPPPGGGGGGGTGPMPWNFNAQELVADIRREMASRGVMLVPGTSTYSQLISQIRTQAEGRLATAASQHFGDVRDEALQTYYDKLSQAEASNNAARQRLLAGETDPAVIQRVNERYDQLLQNEKNRLKNDYEADIAETDTKEQSAVAVGMKELAKAISELTDETRRGNKNSYLNEMRDRYKTAIWNRDNAETEEEARRYSRESQKIQEEISSVVGGDRSGGAGGGFFGSVRPVFNVGLDWGNKLLQLYEMQYNNQIAHIQSLGQFAGGDPFGAMLNENALKRSNYQTWGSIIGGGLGAIVGSIFPGVGTLAGGAIGSAAGNLISGWLGASETKEGDVIANLGRQYQQIESQNKAYNALTMLTRSPEQTIESARDYFIKQFAWGFVNDETGLNNRDLGLDGRAFAQMMAGRIKARGVWDEDINSNYNRAFMAEGLEKVFNLNPNALASLSAFDRYGNDVNQSVTNLFTTLGNRGTIGMTGGHWLRSDEFSGYMQQAMAMQKGWMNPNADFAASQVATLQAMFGDNLDERAMSELGQINNAITNPQAGMASVITNDVIQQLFPSTRGNILAIREKQYSNDPKVRAQIQRAMFNRLTEMYGDVNTSSGYLALSQYTGIQDPDRLRNWVSQMKRGLVPVDEGDQAGIVKQLGTGYTPKLSQEIMKGQDLAIAEINESSKRMDEVSQKIFNVLNENMVQMAKDLRDIKLKVE